MMGFFVLRQKPKNYIYIKKECDMKLRQRFYKYKIKSEYLDYSIAGGKSKRIYLVDLDETELQLLYDNGFSYLFDEVKPLEIVEDIKINKEEDDINQ